ncbi:hypothetical protein [Haloferula sargassicola]|uniref:Uncharacterized protein n=1 Tax=Haloferula sargassicola TaxID=490096 RepID=A0ABP9UJS0_9BACT
MKSFFAMMLAVLFLGAGVSQAANSPAEITEKEAVRLIRLAFDLTSDPIEVVSVVVGDLNENGFIHPNVCRVSVLRLFKGRFGERDKRLECHTFRWSEKYGWYLQCSEKGRLGTEIHIYSELLKEVIIR